MNLYLLLNLAVISVPLALSFDRKVHYVSRWPEVIMSAMVVGLPYLIWDIAATARGDWSFNETYAGGFKIAGLPIPEILFFICVPFACLFLFDVVGAYLKEKIFKVSRLFILGFVPVFVALAVLFRNNPYTFRAFLSVAIFVLLAAWTDLLRKRQFWMYMAVSMAAFFAVNSALTSLPVVMYGVDAIIGVRVLTIPVEDFFYNFSLLGFNALVYTFIFERGRGHG
jgi:lycopene cyclase domain-containing protein